MALPSVIYTLELALSDVDRGVYEALDLRVARHPSETMRHLLLRVIAYALSYEDGVAFSKGGLSAADEPAVSVVDPTGRLSAWIDVGTPSAERLHKASKATPRVAVFTAADPAQLEREAAAKGVHRAAEIRVTHVPAALLDALEAQIARRTRLELTRTGGQLYVTVGGTTLDAELTETPLLPA